MCVREERECVRISERERDKARESMCVCSSIDRKSVCVRLREREREREEETSIARQERSIFQTSKYASCV